MGLDVAPVHRHRLAVDVGEALGQLVDGGLHLLGERAAVARALVDHVGERPSTASAGWRSPRGSASAVRQRSPSDHWRSMVVRLALRPPLRRPGPVFELDCERWLLERARSAIGFEGRAVGHARHALAELLGERAAGAQALLDQAGEVAPRCRADAPGGLRGRHRAAAERSDSRATAPRSSIDSSVKRASSVLLRAHRLGQRGQPLDQCGIARRRGLAALLDALQGADQPVDALGVALEQRLDIGRHALHRTLRHAERSTGWWRAPAIPRARCGSGPAPGSPAIRGSPAPASPTGRTARRRTRSTCP